MKTKTFRPGLESLEVRAVPASLVWRPEAYHLLGPVGGKYGSWNHVNPTFHDTGWWNLSSNTRATSAPSFSDEVLIDSTAGAYGATDHDLYVPMYDAAATRRLTYAPSAVVDLIVEQNAILRVKDNLWEGDSTWEVGAGGRFLNQGSVYLDHARAYWKQGSLTGEGALHVFNGGALRVEAGAGESSGSTRMLGWRAMVGFQPLYTQESAGEIELGTSFNSTIRMDTTSGVRLSHQGVLKLYTPNGKLIQDDPGHDSETIEVYGGEVRRVGGGSSVCEVAPIFLLNLETFGGYDVQTDSKLYVEGKLKISGDANSWGEDITLLLGEASYGPQGRLTLKDGAQLDVMGRVLGYNGYVLGDKAATSGSTATYTITCDKLELLQSASVWLGVIGLGNMGVVTLTINAAQGVFIEGSVQATLNQYGVNSVSQLKNNVGSLSLSGNVVTYGTATQNQVYVPLVCQGTLTYASPWVYDQYGILKYAATKKTSGGSSWLEFVG